MAKLSKEHPWPRTRSLVAMTISWGDFSGCVPSHPRGHHGQQATETETAGRRYGVRDQGPDLIAAAPTCPVRPSPQHGDVAVGQLRYGTPPLNESLPRPCSRKSTRGPTLRGPWIRASYPGQSHHAPRSRKSPRGVCEGIARPRFGKSTRGPTMSCPWVPNP